MANEFFEDEMSYSPKDFSEAVNSFESAFSNKTTGSLQLSEEEFIFLIDKYIEDNIIEKAYEAANRAFALYSYSPDILIRYIDLLIITNNSRQALKLLDENQTIAFEIPEVHFLYARAYINNQLFAKAREHVKSFISNDYSKRELVHTYSALANECMDVDNLKEALFYFNKAESFGALDVDCYSDMAYCYDAVGNLEKAIYYYNIFLDSDPFSDLVWFNMGTLYAKNNQTAKAIEAFDYALALNGTNLSALHNLAVSYLTGGSYEKARDKFLEFIKYDPENIDGYLGAADSFFALGQLDNARVYLQKASSISPDNKEVLIGIECIDAVDEYRHGNRSGFFNKIKKIAERDKGWVLTICKAIPELTSDKQMIEILLEKHIHEGDESTNDNNENN